MAGIVMPSDPSQAERRFAALNWVRERTLTISDPFLFESASPKVLFQVLSDARKAADLIYPELATAAPQPAAA
jgi:hypothetical protein